MRISLSPPTSMSDQPVGNQANGRDTCFRKMGYAHIFLVAAVRLLFCLCVLVGWGQAGGTTCSHLYVHPPAAGQLADTLWALCRVRVPRPTPSRHTPVLIVGFVCSSKELDPIGPTRRIITPLEPMLFDVALVWYIGRTSHQAGHPTRRYRI